MPPADGSRRRRLTRREALAAIGGTAAVGTAGCLGVTHAPSAYCQWKAVMVGWPFENRRYVADVASSRGHPTLRDDTVVDPGTVRTYAAEEFPSLATSARAVRGDDETASILEATFEPIEYHLGFCGDALGGCLSSFAASRADFNAVQVADVAEWDIEFFRGDFSEAFADRGVPLDD